MSGQVRPSIADNLLALLYERREGFTAMAELAAAASAKPLTVRKALAALRRAGQKLEVSPADGVQLVRPVVLNAGLIERDLGTKRVGRDVICFRAVDSTNDVARHSARQTDADGLVVLAEFQRHGRGRLGRRWISPPRSNILMSILLLDRGGELAHEAVTIAAGLAVAEGIDQAVDLSCRLHWPNDVLVDGKKAAGVLVELSRIPTGRAVVVGIGINANSCPTPSRVAYVATSLAEQTGAPVERIEVIRAVLRRLDAWVAAVQAGCLDDLRAAWLARCGMIHQRLTVQCGGRRYVGRVVDIHPLQGLVLVGDHGERVCLPAETSTLLETVKSTQ